MQSAEGSESGKIDIVGRTYTFALRIARIRKAVPSDSASHVLWRQFVRSGTSVGANVEEAQSAQSPKEFVRKMNIALSESREAYYWLRLFRDSSIIDEQRLNDLIDEARQIMRILGAIVSTARKRMENG